MTSDDATPEITNLPRIVMVPNHSEIYRNGRFEPVVPGPPLPAAFKAWLADARRLGYYRRTERGPIANHAMNFPNGDGIIWMSPASMDQRWSRAGERITQQSGFDVDDDLYPRMRRMLAEMRRAILAAATADARQTADDPTD